MSRFSPAALGFVGTLWLPCACGLTSPPCGITHCFARHALRDRVGGELVQVGCCPCPTGSFDDSSCDAG